MTCSCRSQTGLRASTSCRALDRWEVGQQTPAHTDPALALRVYRQAVRRGEDEKAQLRALVEGADVADIGRQAPETAIGATERKAA